MYKHGDRVIFAWDGHEMEGTVYAEKSKGIYVVLSTAGHFYDVPAAKLTKVSR